MTQDFFTPKLSGARFDDHTVPADLLPDIAALQEMLVELAKEAYMKEHPERTRVPRKFDSTVQIHLAGIEDGSAKLKLVFFFAGLFTPYESAFKTAQVEITSAVQAASQGQSPALSQRNLTYFDRLGRGLREDESIGFPTTGGAYAVLNQETRHRLIQAAKVEEWTDRATLRARIPGANYRSEKYEVQLADGTALSGDLQPTIIDQLKNAHGAYGTGKDEWLLLQCTVRKDRSNKIKAIVSVESAAPLEALDVPLRLGELAQLEDGWLDGKGYAPPKDGLEWFSRTFENLYSPVLPLPHVYPTPEGGIQAEWDLGEWSVSLETDLRTQKAEFQALNLSSKECRDLDIDLGNEAGWKSLNEALQELDSATAEVHAA